MRLKKQNVQWSWRTLYTRATRASDDEFHVTRCARVRVVERCKKKTSGGGRPRETNADADRPEKQKDKKQKRGRPLAANTADRGRWKRDRALLTTLTAPVDRRAARWRSVYETDREMTILCNDRNVFCFRNWPSKIENKFSTAIVG